MTLSATLRSAAGFPPRRWRDLAVAMALAARIEYTLKYKNLDGAARLSRVEVRMDGHSAPTGSAVALRFSAREREQLDTAWRVLRHRPFNATCLRRALVGGYFLRDRHPVVRIGVTKNQGAVSAHAWLEIEGVSLDPDGATKYSLLTSVGDQR